MEYKIEIEGLPEGCRPIAFRAPRKGEFYFFDGEILEADYSHNQWRQRLLVEKIKPRRIVLEETGEFREACEGEWIEEDDGGILKWCLDDNSKYKYKIWREVKDDE